MNFPKSVREVVLDTETTGLSYEKGERIVDIACIELVNHVQTGKTYQTYVNPQKKMHREASAISGLTDEFLADKPLFHEIADNFLNFVGDATLVIHNAKFDVGFLNSELERLGKPLFDLRDAVDTLEIARKKFPGTPVNLDALCKRFEIDTSARVTHGALVDCVLLAEVYINLLGGRQSALSFASESSEKQNLSIKNHQIQKDRGFPPSKEEKEAHKEFLKSLNSPLWNKCG
ncbi:MAG: DNA polymerase III subunit epsilon [Holosporaceae bacterium]|jgi:DNA polymerase-3 subunit epsilon|nr:DNA polymerase III subunit epsilon [Holosporaceae bacterium]